MSRAYTIILNLAAIAILLLAVPTARSTWGSAFAFSAIGEAHGAWAVALYEVFRNMAAAAPFGFLYGVVVSRHTALNALGVAFVVEGALIADVARFGLLADRAWWLVMLEVVSLIGAYMAFAVGTKKLFPTIGARTRGAAIFAFVMLGSATYLNVLLRLP